MPSVICSTPEFKRELHNRSHNWLSAVASVCHFEHHRVLYDMTYGNRGNIYMCTMKLCNFLTF